MRAVILAAGAATRLRPLTDETPKCLLPVDGVPILRRAVAVLLETGVTELVIVTGFHAEKIRAAMTSWFPDVKVTWINNDEWATTNNSVSLLMTQPVVEGEPFLMMDADIVFDRGVVDALLRSPHGDVLALRAGHVANEEIKVLLDDRGRVLEIGKHLDPVKAAGESIGIERFSVEGGRAMFRHLVDRVRGKGLVNEWYEASWQQWIEQGGALYAADVGDAYCAEIDTAEDLAHVSQALAARRT